MKEEQDAQSENKANVNVNKEEPPQGQEHLFNDIMLELQVEIGRTKMKISELMKLSTGSIVSLEQNPQDPLIIYANDKAIAKGQIISSNGKYHIRIL